MIHKFLVLFMVIIFSNIVFAQPIKIKNNTTITNSIYEGIKVIKDCKLTFKNMDDIIIGDLYNNICSGIEIAPGSRLVISLEGCGNVNVYGGCYKNLGNMYTCAGIYVPQNSTLEIEGNGVLNVFGCVGASGIGGCGVASHVSDTDYSTTNAGSIFIRGGTITATSCCNSFFGCHGTGAGIGGGGIYNLIDKQELQGGNVELVDIRGGNVVAIGGNSEDCHGTGAGIGGGGICTLAKNVNCVKGGSLKQINVCGGNIIARGGNNTGIKGIGAGIGGGGIYNSGNCDVIVEGRLLNISDEYLKENRNFKENTNIGSGSVYSNGTYIKGILPTVIINNDSTSLGESARQSKKKIISTIAMLAMGVLVMLGK